MADVLVVDDDANLALALEMTLKESGHGSRLAYSAEAGWREIQAREPDLVLLDLQLPDMSGLDLLARIRKRGSRFPIIMMTAFGTVTSAVSAMKRGATDFIEKPLSVREVCALVARLLKSRELVAQIDGTEAGEAPKPEPTDTDLIAASPAMKQALELADRIARLPGQPGIGLPTTLMLGETGTGKEMVARYLHGRSSGRPGRFVHLNCAAIPQTLFESELFGHERGVFTDAKNSKSGLFETAANGTLFLDEIGDMPLPMQSKLLVAIETGRFRRVGATDERTVNARVIAATNADLEQKVKAGQFRVDLYHRLKVFTIQIPPLRERTEDLWALAEHFLRHFSYQLQRSVPVLSAEARETMREYAWPGNVRELAHVLLQALVAGDSPTISAQALGLPAGESADVASGADDLGLSDTVLPFAEVEKRLLQAALNHAGGNITEAARLLGMTRGTLRYRLEKHGMA